MTAQEIEIVKDIKEKYSGKETTTQKIKRLIDLDASVYRSGNIVSLCLGILGLLVFGIGMCYCLLWSMFALGVILGIIGIQIMCLTMTIRNKLVEKKRREVGSKIEILSNEILGEQ